MRSEWEYYYFINLVFNFCQKWNSRLSRFFPRSVSNFFIIHKIPETENSNSFPSLCVGINEVSIPVWWPWTAVLTTEGWVMSLMRVDRPSFTVSQRRILSQCSFACYCTSFIYDWRETITLNCNGKTSIWHLNTAMTINFLRGCVRWLYYCKLYNCVIIRKITISLTLSPYKWLKSSQYNGWSSPLGGERVNGLSILRICKTFDTTRECACKARYVPLQVMDLHVKYH